MESCNLDTQQEREMEQEQEKEVKARRDQQIEVEKFVEREYSRHQERPSPWSIAWLVLRFLKIIWVKNQKNTQFKKLYKYNSTNPDT